MLSFKHILVAIDFSAASSRALELASELAVKFQASLTLVHVCEVLAYAGLSPPLLDFIALLEESAARELQRIVDPLRRKLPSTTSTIRTGLPWQEILEASRETRSDLIIMGTHGRTGFARAWLGSVAEKVVRLATVPVLTVREPREQPDQADSQHPRHRAPPLASNKNLWSGPG